MVGLLLKKIKSKMEIRIADEQGDFRKDRGCVDQVLTFMNVGEQYFNKRYLSKRHTIGWIGKQCWYSC